MSRAVFRRRCAEQKCAVQRAVVTCITSCWSNFWGNVAHGFRIPADP